MSHGQESRVKGVGVIRCTVISATYRVVKVIGPTTDSSAVYVAFRNEAR